MAATIEDVKKLLLRGLDPRNTVNQLNTMLADVDTSEKEPEKPESEKKSGMLRRSKPKDD
jgi:hypothetical protein